MGLDFSHSDAHWSYSGFMKFRTHLAECTGIDLDMMEGFGGDGEWSPPLTEPIIDLLNHSDCDGELTPEQCKIIAPRLRKIVSEWSDSDYMVMYDKKNALLLADGMEEAAANGEPLEFR